MTGTNSTSSTRNSHFIRASQEALYRAFTDPAALATWLAPGGMTGEVHSFDYRVGGGYQMSLYYPSSDATSRGKTSGREDRYTARFVEHTKSWLAMSSREPVVLLEPQAELSHYRTVQGNAPMRHLLSQRYDPLRQYLCCLNTAPRHIPKQPDPVERRLAR